MKMLEVVLKDACFSVHWGNETFQYVENGRVVFESVDYEEVRNRLLESTGY